MRNIEQARAVVIRQLARRDIGDNQQRACLQGMLQALNWMNETGGSVLQELIDGREVIVKLTGTPSGASFSVGGARILTG